MQEDVSGMLQLAVILILTAALFTAVFSTYLQSISFLENYQTKITTLSSVSANTDIKNLEKNDKSFATIYKITQTYPEYINSLVVDFTDLVDYTGEDYVCYKLRTTNLIESQEVINALTECGLNDAGFVDIDNLIKSDTIYGTGDNVVSIGHGSGYIRFKCTVYKCKDGQSYDVYAKCRSLLD